jgi:type II secretory pathway pseudopilin PulG
VTAEPAPSTAPKTSGLAIAALVLSLLFCIPLAPLIGLVLGIVALMQIDKSKGALTGKGMAIGAIVVSLFTIVAAIGMMVAIAIPNFARYQARAKEAEARVSLMQLKTATMSHVAEHRRFPSSDGEWAPTAPCPKAGCDGNEPEWKKEPWTSLQFGFYSKHYFQYRYEVIGEGQDATLTITASGDPDGDGEPMIMTVTGSISSDGDAILEGPLRDLE